MNANIASHLANTARLEPDRTAVRDHATGATLTYGELAERSARIAAGLLEQGLQVGDRVALLLRNSPEYIEVFFGVATAGLVIVPFNTRLATKDFAHMLADAGCSALITEPHFLAALKVRAASPACAECFAEETKIEGEVAGVESAYIEL